MKTISTNHSNSNLSKKNYILNFAAFFVLVFLFQSTSLWLQKKDIEWRKKEIWRKSQSSPEDVRKLFELKQATIDACQRGNEELREYYQGNGTLDLDKYDLEKINSDSISGPVQTLLDLLDGSESFSMDIGINYGKHVFISLLCLVLGILMIFIIVIMLVCNCCGCCCCCCAMKKGCKLPCVFISLLMYLTIAGCCIYGFSQSGKLFEGLGSMTCALLQFSKEILEGETKEALPKWAGVGGLQEAFDNVLKKVENIKSNTYLTMTSDKNIFDNKYNDLKNAIPGNTDPAPSYPYSGCVLEYGDSSTNCDFSVAQLYGPTNREGTFTYGMKQQFDGIVETGKGLIDQASTDFNKICGPGSTLSNDINDAKKKLDDLENTLDSFSGTVSENVDKYSGMIDDYGKKAFKIVFALIFVIDVIIAAFLILYVFFSNITCLSCIVKLVLNISWIIFMVICLLSFIVSGFFTLFGLVGKDLVELMSFVLGKHNLSQPEPKLLKSGEGKDYLNTCLYGDGNLKDQLEFTRSANGMSNINSLSSMHQDIKNLRSQIDKNRDDAYELYKVELDKVCLMKNDFTIYNTEETNQLKSVSGYIDELNDCIRHSYVTNKKYFILDGMYTSGSEFSKITEFININSPSYMFSNENVSPSSGSHCPVTTTMNDVETFYRGQLKNIFGEGLTDAAPNKNTICVGSTSLVSNAGNLDTKYKSALTAEDKSLETFQTGIGDLRSVLDKYLGDDSDMFSMVNCKFIGNNTKILLKYFDEGLGDGFYNVGIALTLSSFAILVGVSMTLISLNIIKKLAQDENKYGGVPKN